jgi:thiol-disulfide isomerase/thioredoxin
MQAPNPIALIGKRIEIPGVALDSSTINLVIFLSTECRFCEASMPFYRRLAEEHHEVANKKVALIAVSAENSEYVTNHLTNSKVQFDGVYQIKLPSAVLSVTPTILVVDKDGVVQRAVVGELNSSKEDEILKIIRSGELCESPLKGGDSHNIR